MKEDTNHILFSTLAKSIAIATFFRPAVPSSQCATTIATFPYTENFETSLGKMRDGKIIPGTYVWLATYSNKGITNILQKGTVTLIH